MEESQIQAFYRGKNIFLTGGSGFLGKAIISKLIRSCPDLGKIFVLIRAKKGSEGKARLDNLLQGPLFDQVKADNPCFAQNIFAIRGDISLPGLGINDEDLKTLSEEVHVMIHSAATVRFDEPIKHAVKVNVGGTLGIINLAKSVKNLQSLIHISTAYTNCDLEVVEEKLYPINMDPEAAISAFETMSDELANSISAKCIDKKPNTYTYTKHLAEKLVSKYASEIPVCIVRPSIIVATYEDPIPGWIDNLYGPTGIFIAGAKGALRTMLLDPHKRLDVIPVDCVANLVLAAAWKTAVENQNKCNPDTEVSEVKEAKIYNCCSGKENPFYLAKTVPWALKAFEDIPFNEVLWHPSCYMTQNPVVHFFVSFLLHLLPAFIIDFKAKMCGEKPFMMYIQRRINTGVTALRYFCLREFDFSMANTKSLYNELSPWDKKKFRFDVSCIDWKLFMKHYVYGMRKYILKEDDKDLDQARENFRRITWLNNAVILALRVVAVTLLSFFVGRALSVL